MFTVWFEITEADAVASATDFGTRLDYFFEDDCFRMVCGQVEKCPQSSRIHFQGYMELRDSMRFTALRNRVKENFLRAGKCDFRRRDGSASQAIGYVTKTATRVAGPWTYGEQATIGRPKLTMEDLIAYLDTNPTASHEDVALKFPMLWMHRHGGIISYMSMLPKPYIPDTGFVPRPWQATLLEKLAAPPDDRHIFWITDVKGKCGKSRLAKHLYLEYGAINLSGKIADMALAFSKKPAKIVVFDISRSAVEKSDHLYGMAENLKNGVIFSGKYQSCECRFEPPHVVFFANCHPEQGKWSEDRCLETILSPSDQNPGPLPTPPISEDDLSALFQEFEDGPEVPPDAFW